jgi:hypothetical protein
MNITEQIMRIGGGSDLLRIMSVAEFSIGGVEPESQLILNDRVEISVN